MGDGENGLSNCKRNMFQKIVCDGVKFAVGFGARRYDIADFGK